MLIYNSEELLYAQLTVTNSELAVSQHTAFK